MYGPEEALGEGPSNSVQQKVRFQDAATPSPPPSSPPLIVGMPEDVEMRIDDGNEQGTAKGLEDERCVTVDIF